jgi:hypothetical protein
LFVALAMKISGMISWTRRKVNQVRRLRTTNIAFIKGLLEHAGSLLDPIKLVKSIPVGMKIEGLKESLIKIFFDHEIQVLHISILISDESVHWRGKDFCDGCEQSLQTSPSESEAWCII